MIEGSLHQDPDTPLFYGLREFCEQRLIFAWPLCVRERESEYVCSKKLTSLSLSPSLVARRSGGEVMTTAMRGDRRRSTITERMLSAGLSWLLLSVIWETDGTKCTNTDILLQLTSKQCNITESWFLKH